MKKNIIITIVVLLAAALSVVSCSSEKEDASAEARVAELKHKICVAAAEYGVKDFTINEEKLKSHLDMTDAEIDEEFKSIVSMAGTYVGKKETDGRYHLYKIQSHLTRYSGLYPEQWTGGVDGRFVDGDWTVSFSLDYYYADDSNCKVSCSNVECEIFTSSGNYGKYTGYVTEESSVFSGSIAFDYYATICVYYEKSGALRKRWSVQCSYDENSDDNDLIVEIY